jgi:hypothetical protein
MRNGQRSVALAVAFGFAMATAIGGAVSAATPTSCGTWRPVWSPNPAGRRFGHYLYGVAALSPGNVLAVGSSGPGFLDLGRIKPLVERWDGTSWTTVTPVVPDEDSGFTDIARIGPGSAWAVGSRNVAGHAVPLIERLSGGTWSIVPSPSRPAQTTLSAVDSVTADDAWAVGSSSRTDSDRDRTLAMHWDGTSWTIEPTPTPPLGGQLQAVDMLTSADGWAVGFRRIELADGTPSDRALIQHWDGTAWTAIPTPMVGDGKVSELSDVAVRSATDAIAVGSFSSPNQTRPLALHWDGTRWSRMSFAGVDVGPFSSLSGIALSSGGTAYGVGASGDHQQNRPLAVRWDGGRWTRMPISTAPETFKDLDAVVALSATNVISVGFRSSDPVGDYGKTFAVHCTP